jgi:hypothetical protein
LDDRSCLLVLLGQEVGLAVLPSCPAERVDLPIGSYAARSRFDFVGFYDWLRDTSGRVIGVRETFSDGLEWILDAMPHLAYVEKLSRPAAVEIFFGIDRAYDPTESTDQDFLMNRVYVSESGGVAMTFGMDPEVRDQLADYMEDAPIGVCGVR